MKKKKEVKPMHRFRFIYFSALNNKLNISNINILAQGGSGNDRTIS